MEEKLEQTEEDIHEKEPDMESKNINYLFSIDIIFGI